MQTPVVAGVATNQLLTKYATCLMQPLPAGAILTQNI